MKTLITLLSVASLAACVATPSKEDTLARLAEIRSMPCEQLELKRLEYYALQDNASGGMAAGEFQRRKCPR